MSEHSLKSSERTLAKDRSDPIAAPQTDDNKSAPLVAAPRPRRRKWPWVVGLIGLVVAAVLGIPWLLEVMSTVSTDDAYVNGHFTFVAPRVGGQVKRVLVDDNNVVHVGDTLVELDPEPFQVRVDIAQAALVAAKADLKVAEASVRGNEGLMRSLRFGLERATEDVDDKIAVLRFRIATLDSKTASLRKAESDYQRNRALVEKKAISQQEMESYTEARLVAQAQVTEALQAVYQTRVSLGLPATPVKGNDLSAVPHDLNQTFSAVREAQAKLMQAAATVGVIESFNKTPNELVKDFYKRDPQGNIDKIYEKLLKESPGIVQAEAKVLQAERDLDEAKLNLRYCTVVAEIDGVVARRNVNPGNNVVVGQTLMALRSITEIWIDANFKETQLARLRIGQPVTVEADMYGRSHKFSGRISGFTFGTGSTLALLPPQNATGNFVKVVQRLPVRIDLTDYDPHRLPLFIGLSVTPKVHINEEPTGPDAGEFLQEPGSAAAVSSGQEDRS
ncbi:MAG TPA: HlyD family secretion protein [Pirellulales bacterium]|jgi:membrane fusion protein (multidrug efflux system)|nr:HlyD family secretion protein [Pirellulales bacterium]